MRPRALLLLPALALAGCGGGAGGSATSARTPSADLAAVVRVWSLQVRGRPHVVDVIARGRIGAPGLPAADLRRLQALVPTGTAVRLAVDRDGEVVATSRPAGGLAVALGPDGPPLASRDGRTWKAAAGPLAASVRASGAARQGGLVGLASPGLRLRVVPGSGGTRLAGAAPPALVAAALPALARPGVLAVRSSRLEVALDGAEVRSWAVTVQAVADLSRLDGTAGAPRVGVAASLAASARAVAGVPSLPAPRGTATSPADL